MGGALYLQHQLGVGRHCSYQYCLSTLCGANSGLHLGLSTSINHCAVVQFTRSACKQRPLGGQLFQMTLQEIEVHVKRGWADNL